MKVCPNCHNNLEDSAVFCHVCGATMPVTQQGENTTQVPPQGAQYNSQVPPQGVPYYNQPAQPVVDQYDHTAEFDQKDIEENKLMAMLVYLLSIAGVVIALLSKKESAYLDFHIRQGIKLVIVETLVSLVTALFCWTCIVPAAGSIFLVVLAVIQIIAFFDVCNGKAKEPAIIRSIKFLK